VSTYSICWLAVGESEFNKIDIGRMVYIQVTVGVGFSSLILIRQNCPL